MKQKLRQLACKAYAAAETMWFSKLVYHGAPLVRFLDATTGSSCKYCMACRALMLGAGVALFNVAGLVLIALAIGLTFFEHFCEEN